MPFHKITIGNMIVKYGFRDDYLVARITYKGMYFAHPNVARNINSMLQDYYIDELNLASFKDYICETVKSIIPFIKNIYDNICETLDPKLFRCNEIIIPKHILIGKNIISVRNDYIIIKLLVEVKDVLQVCDSNNLQIHEDTIELYGDMQIVLANHNEVLLLPICINHLRHSFMQDGDYNEALITDFMRELMTKIPNIFVCYRTND